MEDTHKTLINDKKHLDRIGKIQWQKIYILEKLCELLLRFSTFANDCATFFFTVSMYPLDKGKSTCNLCKCTVVKFQCFNIHISVMEC